jgi:site-specific recombinase XerD
MKTTRLSDLLPRYFTEYLQQNRNVSRHTIAAYRDTFRLLFRFLKQAGFGAPADMDLKLLTPERVLAFLNHLEKDRGNTIRSRNARLATVRCFVHYLQDLLGPDLPEPTRRILSIPPKRHTRPVLGFLTRLELEAILGAAEDSWSGQRDHLLFLLLYNTGARVSEILDLRVRDVVATGSRHLALHGKGRKERTIPLWRSTQTRLRQWIKANNMQPDVPLLPNRFGQPLTRSGAAWQLRQLVQRAAKKVPSLQSKRVTPHTFRHTTAMHLLQEGVAPEIIALWLGHESLNTTHDYVEADLDMKRKALNLLGSPKKRATSKLRDDGLLRFLDNL